MGTFTKNKAIFLFVLIAFVFSLLCTGCSSNDKSTVNEELWEVLPEIDVTSTDLFEYKENSSGEIVITDYTGTEKKVHVPEKIDGKPVVSVQLDKCKLTELVVPDTVKSLSFDNENIQYINLPAGLSSDGANGLFSDCVSLKGVYIGGEEVTGSAFWGCENLEKVFFADTVKKIGSGAFANCTKLDEAVLPENLEELGEFAFAWCSSLSEITLPEGITETGNRAFFYCKNLKSITFSEGITKIGVSAFECCESIETLTFPDSLREIDSSAFFACSELRSIDNFKSVKKIGENAFAYCNKLGLTELSDNIEIGNNAFLSCDNITLAYKGLNYTNGNSLKYDIENGLVDMLLETSMLIDGESFIRCAPEASSITVPDGVKSIEEYAFFGCSSLREVNIPDSVTEIAENAFEDCRDISINYKGLSYHDGEALYYDMTNGLLEKLVGNDMLIENGVLVRCNPDIRTADIPASVARIGDYAFFGCTELENVNIPDNVLYIGKYSFGRCTAIIIIVIGPGVQHIDEYAFTGCSGLTSVSFPEKLSSVGRYAFEECTSLAEVNLPEGLTTVGDRAFNGCTSLKTVTVPTSVSSLGSSVFGDCESLEKVIYDGKNYNGDSLNELYEEIKNVVTVTNGTVVSAKNRAEIVIPEGVEEIGDGAFANLDNLVKVTIPDTVTVIGSNAFSGCTSLTEVNIPEGVTSIGENAFKDCVMIIVIVLPDGLESIGSYAFSGCTGLTSISVPDSVTKITEDVFSGCGNLTATYKEDSFGTGDIQDFYDSVNGKLVRKEISYELAESLIGYRNSNDNVFQYFGKVNFGERQGIYDLYNLVIDDYLFDDINKVSLEALLCLLKSKDCYGMDWGQCYDDNYHGYYARSLSDMEKDIKKYLNPDFDLEKWKKNVGWNKDNYGAYYYNDDYFVNPWEHGATIPESTLVIEDYYSIGNKYYITTCALPKGMVGEFDLRDYVFRNKFSMSDILRKNCSETYNSYDEIGNKWEDYEYLVEAFTQNPRFQFVYTKSGDSYYLESVKQIEINELPQWEQAMIKAFDEMYSYTPYILSVNFACLDVNNDGVKDAVFDIYYSYNDLIIFSGADAKKLTDGYGGWYAHLGLSLQRHTVTGEIVLQEYQLDHSPFTFNYYSLENNELLYYRCSDAAGYTGEEKEEIYREGFRWREYEDFDHPKVSLEEINLQEFLTYVHDNMA